VCGSDPQTPPQRVRAATLFLDKKKAPHMSRLVLVLALLCTTQAHAATRSYSFPGTTDERIGTCLADGQSCGKIAADAFCKQQGFSESILFSREKSLSARIIDSGALCEGDHCEAFQRIKCYQPVAAAAG